MTICGILALPGVVNALVCLCRCVYAIPEGIHSFQTANATCVSAGAQLLTMSSSAAKASNRVYQLVMDMIGAWLVDAQAPVRVRLLFPFCCVRPTIICFDGTVETVGTVYWLGLYSTSANAVSNSAPSGWRWIDASSTSRVMCGSSGCGLWKSNQPKHVNAFPGSTFVSLFIASLSP